MPSVARRRIRTTEEELDDPPAAAAPSEETADLLAAAEEGQPARQPHVRVSRVNPEDGKPGFLAVIAPNLATEAYLTKRWGGGTYHLLTYGMRTDKKFGYLKDSRREVIIDPSIPFRANGAAPTNGVEPASGGDTDERFLLKTQMMEMMRDQAESRQQSSMMMMTMMKTMTESSAAMTQAIAAMVSGLNRPDGTKELLAPILTALVANKSDPLDGAVKLAGLVNGRPRESMKDMISAFSEFTDMRDLLRGGGDHDDEEGTGKWFKLVEKIAPGVMELLQRESTRTGVPVKQLALRSAAGSSGPSAPTAAIPSTTTPTPTPGAPAAVPDEWTPLEPYMNQLAGYAGMGKEAYGVMVTVKTLAPPAMLDAIKQLVQRDDAADILCNRFPALAQYKMWVTELVDEFYTEFFGEDDDAPEPPHHPPDEVPAP